MDDTTTMGDTPTGEPTVIRLLPLVSELGPHEPVEVQAEAVSLVYVDVEEVGIRRVRRGRGFSYVRPDGSTLQGEDRKRVEALAVPPAWGDVWICQEPRGHVQATGIDDAGRKQYRYHPRWRTLRDATKFHRMGDVAHALPRLRAGIDADLRRRNLDRNKVMALIAALLDETLIRIGTDRHARTTGARGLTTLHGDHVDVIGSHIRFAFPGKSGQEREIDLRHPRLARQVLRCEEIPGQQLFTYEQDGSWQQVDSEAVNRYLQETAETAMTAKDFRTWGATVVVAETLHQLSPGDSDDRRANVLKAIDAAAERLGNTRAVARTSYVDPRITAAYRSGRLLELWDHDPDTVDRMSPAERAVQRVLELDPSPSVEA